MDLNLVVFSLDYTVLLCPLAGLFESNTGLWRKNLGFPNLTSLYNLDHARVLDNAAVLQDTVSRLSHHSLPKDNCIDLSPSQDGTLMTVCIQGSETFINNCRTEILKRYTQVAFKRVTLQPEDVAQITPAFLHKLSSISATRNVEISINNTDIDYRGSETPSASTHVYIVGSVEDLTRAEIETRVAVDALLKDFVVGKVDVPLSLLPSMGGPNMANFQELAHLCNVNMYLPYLMPRLFSTDNCDSPCVWLTLKLPLEVHQAKRIIEELRTAIDPRSKSMYRSFVPFSRDKLDLVLLFWQHEVCDIMFRCGTFVLVPTLGQPAQKEIVCQGSLQERVDECSRLLADLSCGIQRLLFRFSDGPNHKDAKEFLMLLCRPTCVVTYNHNGFDIVATKEDMQRVFGDIVSGPMAMFAKDLEVSIALELGTEQREFLSGKKNGKVIKILNQLNHIPTIRFNNLNDYNFEVAASVKAEGSSRKQVTSTLEIVMRTLLFLEMELPATLEFNIPEIFHKSIIGNSGLVIQGVMKRYNVFVKFSSSKADCVKDLLLFSLQRAQNVLIKCPAKNRKNIAGAKFEIDRLVTQCCQNSGTSAIYNTAGFRLLKSHYLLLTERHKYDLSFVSNLENEHSTFIDYPASLSAFKDTSVVVEIKGGDVRPQQCALRLAEMLPHTFEFQVTFCPNERFTQLLNEQNAEFREKIIIPFRLLLGVELVCNYLATDSQPFHQILVSSFDVEKAERANADLTHYLREKNFLIIERQRIDFDPIVFNDYIGSPTRLPTRLPARLPQRLPTKARQTPSKARNSPKKSPSRSPQRTLALQPITNQLEPLRISEFPILGHPGA